MSGGRVLQGLSTRPARWVAVMILLVVGGFFVPQGYVRMTRKQGNDLTVYVASARALMRGQDPYTISLPQGHAPYPLTIDTLLIPLTWIPMWLAQILWFGVNGAALVGVLRVVERLWEQAPGGASVTATVPFVVRLAGVVVAFVTPFQSHFTLGQMDLVVLGLCGLFVRADLAGRPSVAAFWLGGAIAMKLTPLVLVIGPARRRQYRMLALTGVWVLLLTLGLPALVSNRVLGLYGEAWVRVLRARVEGPVSLWGSRFTLAGLLTYVWPPFATVPGLHYWATAAVLAPIVVAAGWIGLEARGRLLVFALSLVAIPLVSPISETHHLTMLAAALWIWMLAAGTPPPMKAVDLMGAGLFLGGHWVALGLAGPAASRRVTVFDVLALIGLYMVLLVRSLTWRPAGPAVGSNGSSHRLDAGGQAGALPRQMAEAGSGNPAPAAQPPHEFSRQAVSQRMTAYWAKRRGLRRRASRGARRR